MRIISKFRDYYDCHMAYDQDRETIYLRDRGEEEKISIDKLPPFAKFTDEWHLRDIRHWKAIHIGFCGKIHSGFYFQRQVWGDRSWGCRTVSHHCWDIEDCDRMIEQIDDKDCTSYYHRNPRNISPNRLNRRSLERFFEEAQRISGDFQHLFDEFDAPIFVYETFSYRSDCIRRSNPELHRYEFHRVLSSYDAYQNLVMWFGNLAEPRKPIPPISDETMASIKGFNRYSFRKDPSKKRKKKV